MSLTFEALAEAIRSACMSGGRPTMMVMNQRVYKLSRAALAYPDQMRRLRRLRQSPYSSVRRLARREIAALRMQFDNNFRDS